MKLIAGVFFACLVVSGMVSIFTVLIWLNLIDCLNLFPFLKAQLTPKQHARIKEISEICEEELIITLDESFLKPEPYDGSILFNDDNKTKVYTFGLIRLWKQASKSRFHFQMFVACFLTKLGAVSPDGMILASKLLEFMAEGNVAAELEDAVVKCAAVEGDSLEDRAYNFHKCYLAERMSEV